METAYDFHGKENSSGITGVEINYLINNLTALVTST